MRSGGEQAFQCRNAASGFANLDKRKQLVAAVAGIFTLFTSAATG